MTLKRLLSEAEFFLQHAGVADFILSARVLMGFVFNKTPEAIFIGADEIVQDEYLVDEYRKLVALRAKRVPVAYLTKQKEFFSRTFYVDERVLIPRPETEHIVEQALKILHEETEEMPLVCDVGCGSGAIGITLQLEYPKARVVSADISQDALEITKINAQTLGAHVRCIQSNLLSSVQGPFNLVVANLPYIPRDEIAHLEKDVGCYEPRCALDGGADGVDLIRSLIPQAYAKLKPGGYLILEFGINQHEELLNHFIENRFNHVRVLPDLAGIPRIALGRRS